MKTWIDGISRIAAGMLFQGGYVTSTTMLAAGRTKDAFDGARPGPGACGSRAVVFAQSSGAVGGEPDAPGQPARRHEARAAW